MYTNNIFFFQYIQYYNISLSAKRPNLLFLIGKSDSSTGRRRYRLSKLIVFNTTFRKLIKNISSRTCICPVIGIAAAAVVVDSVVGLIGIVLQFCQDTAWYARKHHGLKSFFNALLRLVCSFDTAFLAAFFAASNPFLSRSLSNSDKYDLSSSQYHEEL